jgi:transposase
MVVWFQEVQNNHETGGHDMKHIGMDAHSTTSLMTVLNDRGRKILQRQVPTRESDLIDFMKSIPDPKRIALEESQVADFVTRILEPYVKEVIRCQPQHNRLISESENKCDPEDSYHLAELLYLNKLKPVHHPAWGYRQLREAVRSYWTASWDLARVKTRLKAFYLFNGIPCQGEKVYSKRYRKRYVERLRSQSGNINLLELHYENLDSCRERKAGHIRVLRKLAEPYQEEVGRLKGIPGIGPIGAYTLLAYLEDGWRIPNKRKLWQYCGIGIRRHDSNGKGYRGASRKGNRYLKNVLMTAASSIASGRGSENALALRWQSGLAAGIAADRLRRNQARKIAVLAQYVLRTKESYNDERVMTTQ